MSLTVMERGKKDPTTRIRTRDRPMAAIFHYSRTLYQLSYCRKLIGLMVRSAH